jgi:lysophospholipase L1-like esterase
MRFNFIGGGWKKDVSYAQGDALYDENKRAMYYVNHTAGAGHKLTDPAYWLPWGGPGTVEYSMIEQALDKEGYPSIDARIDEIKDAAGAASSQLAAIANQISKNSIVATGDSITSGNEYTRWVDFLAWMLNKPIINKGVSGDKTADLLARLDADVIALKPKYCLIMIGTNDVGSVSLSTSASNIKSISSALVAAGIIPIYISIIPNTGDNATVRQNRINYNRFLEQHCRDKGFDFIDVYSLFVGTNGEYTSAMYADATHPNARGTYPIAKAIYTKVKAYITMNDQVYLYPGEVQGCPNSTFEGDTNSDGLANGWSAGNESQAATLTLSAHPTKGNWQNIAKGEHNSAAEFVSIYCVVDPSAWAAGSYTDIEFDLKTGADISTCAIVGVAMPFNNDMTNLGEVNLMRPGSDMYTNLLQSEVTDGIRIRGSILTPETTDSMRFYFYIFGVPACDVSIGNVSIRKRLAES